MDGSSYWVASLYASSHGDDAAFVVFSYDDIAQVDLLSLGPEGLREGVVS